MSFEVELGGWPGVLSSLVGGKDLTRGQAQTALTEILEGRATHAQVAGFLVALRMKGETAEEVTGLVDAMLEAARPLAVPDTAIDIVGTGGSGTRRVHALNVSTMAALVAAGAGAVVCKHGNRRASSTSGSFDLLEALGVTVELDPEAVAGCVARTGCGFAFARLFHPAMRHAAPVRAELGMPTIFNLLGPLSHPGHLTRQVVGVSDPDAASLVVGALRSRGAVRAMVVHGDDGLDELTTTTTTTIHELREGDATTWRLDPVELGIDRADPADLAGGSAEDNARIAAELLSGATGPVHDIVVLNAAAGLVVADVAEDLADGVARARSAVAEGRARAVLDQLVAVSASLAS